MSLNATAVEILIDKGRFEPEVALGIAEAIEVSMTKSEFVTVTILDARLHELRADTRMSFLALEHKMDARFQDLKSEMDRRFGEMDAKTDLRFGELDAKMDRRFAETDAKMDRRFAETDAKMDLRFGELDARVDRKYGELELKMEKIKSDLVRWVFLVMLGNVALSAGATAALNALNHLR